MLAKKEILRLRLRYLAAALPFIAGPALADCQMTRAATLPLLSGDRPLIEASINGKAVQMVVDTGAQGSSVTPETVTELGLPQDPNRRTTVTTIGGKDVIRNVILEKMRIATIDYSSRSVAVVALDGNGMRAPPAGLIGANMLSEFEFELDIPRRMLALYRVADCTPTRPPWEGPYQTISGRMSSRHDFLFPVELNGQSVTALFDTGSRGETLSRAAAKSLGITDAQLDKDPTNTGTSAGLHGYATRRHRFDTFKIGTETFHDAPLDVVDFHQSGVDMLVGVDYMHWRRFFLSYSAGLLFIQKEPDPAIRQSLTSPLPADRAHNPCQPAPDILPTLALRSPVVVSRPRIDLPEKAQADHINGCAAAMFHLAADGTPIDIKPVTESPTGYGLGDFIVRELAATKYQPQPAELKWYYEVHRFHGLP